MTLLAAIAEGKTDAADVFFLIAAILFAIAFVVVLTVRPLVIDRLLAYGAGFCIAVGLLLL